MVKISPDFLQRLIDTFCYTSKMYKVELRICTEMKIWFDECRVYVR